jgi:predicted GIY-YIG superfamily endonuclease
MKYYVYVIELDPSVGKIVKFRKQSPHYLFGNRCFYVGQSAQKPPIRFKQHKDGYKSNTYARKFGLKLVPQFYEKYNPIPTRKDAEELESYIAQKLRKERFGVWSN